MSDFDQVLEEGVDSLHSLCLVVGQDGGSDVAVMQGLDEYDPELLTVALDWYVFDTHPQDGVVAADQPAIDFVEFAGRRC
jgi:hypothetical protein